MREITGILLQQGGFLPSTTAKVVVNEEKIENTSFEIRQFGKVVYGKCKFTIPKGKLIGFDTVTNDLGGIDYVYHRHTLATLSGVRLPSEEKTLRTKMYTVLNYIGGTITSVNLDWVTYSLTATGELIAQPKGGSPTGDIEEEFCFVLDFCGFEDGAEVEVL